MMGEGMYFELPQELDIKSVADKNLQAMQRRIGCKLETEMH